MILSMYGQPPLVAALAATAITWAATTAGAASVWFMPTIGPRLLASLLALSAGAMIAAGIGSLWLPAVDHFAGHALPAWALAAVWVGVGAIAAAAARRLVVPRGQGRRVGPMLFGVMSAHHVPEGMAVGLAVAAVGQGDAMSAGALVLAMAVHNTFEGMAVSVPLHAEGLSRGRSFAFGQASGLFEVGGGVLGAAAVAFSSGVLPYGLAVAAGAMLFVALGDVLPEARRLSAPPRVAVFASAGAAMVVAMQWLGG